MNLKGTATVPRPRDEAFERMLDPEVLKRCIPGCESLRAVTEDLYDVVVRAGIGPVKGNFEGSVTLSGIDAPCGYRMEVEGKGTVGFVEGSADVSLEPGEDEDWTVVRYDGVAKVSGVIASVGGRLVEAAARKLAREFFERMAAQE